MPNVAHDAPVNNLSEVDGDGPWCHYSTLGLIKQRLHELAFLVRYFDVVQCVPLQLFSHLLFQGSLVFNGKQSACLRLCLFHAHTVLIFGFHLQACQRYTDACNAKKSMISLPS
jgi:hypothetical protein